LNRFFEENGFSSNVDRFLDRQKTCQNHGLLDKELSEAAAASSELKKGLLAENEPQIGTKYCRIGFLARPFFKPWRVTADQAPYFLKK
jgi:hypothetical protein